MSASTSHADGGCQKCHGPNPVWHAPSPLWNVVMRVPVTLEDGVPMTLEDAWGVVCPPCFAELAEAKGVGGVWHFTLDGLDVATLWKDRDGRIWDGPKCLWVAPSEAST